MPHLFLQFLKERMSVEVMSLPFFSGYLASEHMKVCLKMGDHICVGGWECGMAWSVLVYVSMGGDVPVCVCVCVCVCDCTQRCLSL